MEVIKKHNFIFRFKWIIGFFLIIGIVLLWYADSHSNPKNCEKYTENYAKHKSFYIGKQKYFLEICDLGGQGDWSKALIRLYADKNGERELLARRSYYIGDAETRYAKVYLEKYENGEKYYIYYRGSENDDNLHIDLPPSKLDWLLARLP
jgi:hypothetical protein